jgi:hypothetical protein
MEPEGIIFLFHGMRWDWVHLVCRPLIGLLYQPQMMDVYGEFGGMRTGRENWSTQSKPAPVPLCPPQIPHDLTWDRTQAATVESQRLTAWVMAWPEPEGSLPCYPGLCPYHPTLLLEDPYTFIPQSMPGCSKSSLPFKLCDQNFVFVSHLSHACYIPYPSHLLALITPNILCRVQTLTLLIAQFFLASSFFLLLISKYTCLWLNVEKPQSWASS